MGRSISPVARVLVIELIANIAVAGAKAITGLLTGSIAILADAGHSLVDGFANVIGLFAVRWSAVPPDREHPYGHRKIEIMAALALGVAVGAAGLRVGWSAIDALISGAEPLIPSALGFAVLGATLVVNIAVATWEARKARELESEYLAADAAHTASDIIVTLGVLAAYSASGLGLDWADPIGALIVVVVIARVAFGIIGRNLSVLLDAAVLDPAEVARVARACDGVEGCHRIRSRGLPSSVQLDLHLQVDGDLSLREAHAISHRVEERLRAQLPGLIDVTIHVEPDDDEPEGL
jgi:cation diffusion facilitator family transporter